MNHNTALSAPSSTLRTSALLLTLTLATSLFVTGCATRSNSSTVYSSGQTQREQVVRMAVVESVRQVVIENRGEGSGVGPLAGAVVGGVAGGGMGGGRGSVVTAVIGAVAGGIAGQAIENSANKENGLEITVRLENGEMRAIVQLADESFQPGERVRILSSGGSSRVTH